MKTSEALLYSAVIALKFLRRSKRVVVQLSKPARDTTHFTQKNQHLEEFKPHWYKFQTYLPLI